MAEIKEEKTVNKLKFGQFFGRHSKIMTLVLVIIVCVIGYYILVPKYQEISGGRYDLVALEEKKQSQEHYLQSLTKLVTNYKEINQSDVEDLNQILPDEKDIPGLFVQLQTLAEKNGFVLTSVNINEEPEEVAQAEGRGEIKKLNISLNLIGRNYQTLKRFLDALEYNLRLFDVNAVYFNSDSNDYSVNLFTYYFVSQQ